MNDLFFTGKDSIMPLMLFSIWALFAFKIARGKSFFILPKTTPETEKSSPITWKDLALTLVLFFFSLFLSFIFAKHITKLYSSNQQLVFAVWVNVFAVSINTVAFSIYTTICKKNHWRSIWKQTKENSSLKDLCFGAFSWFIAFPIFQIVSLLLFFLLSALFNIQIFPDQNAIEILKAAKAFPSLLTLMLICVTLLAPIYEEIVFRGILQNFLKKHLGRGFSIFLTSVFFSIFHFSFQQKINNLIILSSLFILALFLGFVYEKRKSLFSSIALHATFNTINVLILFITKEI